VEVYEAVLTPTHVGLVMEYAAGGALTGYIAEAWVRAEPGGLVLPLNTARFLFRQFVRAVCHCHALGVAHRDLKLDNTLLDGSSPPVLKIADFGFARRCAPLDRATSHLGTPEYMSPELLHPPHAPPIGGTHHRRSPSLGRRGSSAATADGGGAATDGGVRPADSILGAAAPGAAWPPRQPAYDPRAADVWAAGVFLCVTLLGAFPFDHSGGAEARLALADHELELYTQEVTRDWKSSPFIAANVRALPPDARALLDRIFEIDPARRITMAEIAASPFCSGPIDDPRYSDALAALDAAQARVDAHVAHRRVDPTKVRARIAALRALLEEGASPPPVNGVGHGDNNGGRSGGSGGIIARLLSQRSGGRGGAAASAAAARSVMRPLQQLDEGSFLARVDLSEASVLVDGSHACGCAGEAERERLAAGLPPTGSTARADEAAAAEAAVAEAARSRTATPAAGRGGGGVGGAAASPFAAEAGRHFSSTSSGADGGGGGGGG
jgi:serine/threonine protein kinase